MKRGNEGKETNKHKQVFVADFHDSHDNCFASPETNQIQLRHASKT